MAHNTAATEMGLVDKMAAKHRKNVPSHSRINLFLMILFSLFKYRAQG